MRRVLLIGLTVNLSLAVIEGGYGLVSASVALQADGIHALLHALGSVVGLAGVFLAGRPADASHPYGYERYEPLAALGTVAFTLLAVREILVGALERFSGGAPPTVTALSFGAAGIAIACGVGLGGWEMRRGRELSSSVLLADGKRALSAALVSCTVAVGLAGAALGLPILDALVALGIAGVIAWTGWSMLREISAVLTGASACGRPTSPRACSPSSPRWRVTWSSTLALQP
ncbi:MAG: cation diffusion facilitator family transporter [Chloroflexota bacterium]